MAEGQSQQPPAPIALSATLIPALQSASRAPLAVPAAHVPGLLSRLHRRLRLKTGIHVKPHALRRTFTILSLRSGMDVLHLQALGGWAGLEMVAHYAQIEDIDLIEAHREHSPVDRL